MQARFGFFAQCRWLFVLGVVLLAALPANAQDAAERTLNASMAEWDQILHAVEQQTIGGDLTPVVADQLQRKVQRILDRTYREEARIETNRAGLRAEAVLLAQLKPGAQLPPELGKRRQVVADAVAQDQATL